MLLCIVAGHGYGMVAIYNSALVYQYPVLYKTADFTPTLRSSWLCCTVSSLRILLGLAGRNRRSRKQLVSRTPRLQGRLFGFEV